MDWFKAFPIDIDLENQFQNFIFEKSDFFRSAQAAWVEKQTTFCTITFHLYTQMKRNLACMEDILCPHLVEKFQPK